jgi:hypothetical protein
MAKIQPVSAFGKTATQLIIGAVHVEPSVCADFNAVLRDESGNDVYRQAILIAGDEYNAWGSDDNYLITIAAQKLGVTLI